MKELRRNRHFDEFFFFMCFFSYSKISNSTKILCFGVPSRLLEAAHQKEKTYSAKKILS